MYILVEIIHTEFQYISLIEMQKYNWNRKRIEKIKTGKKGDILSRLVTPTGIKWCASHVGAGSTFCPGWCYQPGQKVLFCPGCQTRDKRAPLLSRTGVPGWETGTTAVSQPGQINVFVVVAWPNQGHLFEDFFGINSNPLFCYTPWILNNKSVYSIHPKINVILAFKFYPKKVLL